MTGTRGRFVICYGVKETELVRYRAIRAASRQRRLLNADAWFAGG